MALRVEHELHRRRWGRNLGVGLVLLALVAIVFGLTVVKVLNLGNLPAVEGDSHAAQSPSVPDAAGGAD